MGDLLWCCGLSLSLHAVHIELIEGAAYSVEKDIVNIKIAMVFLNINVFSSVSGVIIFGKDLIFNQKMV